MWSGKAIKWCNAYVKLQVVQRILKVVGVRRSEREQQSSALRAADVGGFLSSHKIPVRLSTPRAQLGSVGRE